jgi:hypothetical protein
MDGVRLNLQLGGLVQDVPTLLQEWKRGHHWVGGKKVAELTIEAVFQHIPGWRPSKVYYLDGNPHNLRPSNVRCILNHPDLARLYRMHTPTNEITVSDNQFNYLLAQEERAYYENNQRITVYHAGNV